MSNNNQPLTAEEMLDKHIELDDFDCPFRGSLLIAMEKFATQQTASLQARVEELERDNEKLMGLLRQLCDHMYKTDHWDNENLTKEEYWQSFCDEHGLTQ